MQTEESYNYMITTDTPISPIQEELWDAMFDRDNQIKQAGLSLEYIGYGEEAGSYILLLNNSTEISRGSYSYIHEVINQYLKTMES